MRKTLAKLLKKNDYLVHCDMFNTTKFPTKAIVVDCSLGENNALNIAAGLANENSTVVIYGVAGFIIHRYEQLKFSARDYGSKKGKIIICNAGKYGYDNLGPGHALDDDKELMSILNIPFYEPNNVASFKSLMKQIAKQSNRKQDIYYIQLGRDE